VTTPHAASADTARSGTPGPDATDPTTGPRVGTFALGTFSSAGRAFPALVHPDAAAVDLSDRFRDLHEVFDDWETNFAVLGDIAAGSAATTLHVDDLHPLPPLSHPNLLCAGANYKTHVAQMLTKNVNGQVMQDSPVTDFVFGPAQYVTYASERVNLLPSDIISMGSPPGNGAYHGRFLHDGDVIDSELTYLGRQCNRCVPEDLHGRTPHFGLWTNT